MGFNLHALDQMNLKNSTKWDSTQLNSVEGFNFLNAFILCKLFTFLPQMPSKDLPQDEEITKVVFDDVVFDVINFEKEITGDIVQGLPRIEELLEARKKKPTNKYV